MFICWSAKGGSGTTVVASSLALVLSRSEPTLLVDLGGDVPAALGVADPSGPGVRDWLASTVADADALHRLAVPVAPGLHLVPRGIAHAVDPTRWAALADALRRDEPTVVLDLGTETPAPALVSAAEQVLLVVRPCYLALRRVVERAVVPTGVVVVNEPGRALNAGDVARSVGAPVVAEIPYDPAVARAIDAGLLAARMPRSLAGPLEGVA